jgi:hypothetical protein
MTEPVSEHREYLRRAIGFLTAVELNEKAGASLIDGWMTTEDLHALISAVLILCKEFATLAAESQQVDRLEIYRQTAADLDR